MSRSIDPEEPWTEEEDYDYTDGETTYHRCHVPPNLIESY
jgi:hypothetical protein